MRQSQGSLPPYLELDQFRRSVERRFWITNLGLMTLAFGSVAAAYMSYARPIPVVLIDQGKPVLFEDTVTPRLRPDAVRIEYFADQFVRRFVGIDSANLEMDLTEALNMMTPRMRQATVSEGSFASRRAFWKDTNARTYFDDADMMVRIGRYDADDPLAHIPVLVTGKMTYGAKFGDMPAGSPEHVEYFAARLELERVEMTRQTIFGLAVNWASIDKFTSREQFENHFRSKDS